jgi:hypothetical protein
MEADLLSCKGSKADAKKAKESFDLAIVTSDKAGFLQDTALANELAGEFYLKILGAELSCRHYFEAYHLYKKWGDARPETITHSYQSPNSNDCQLNCWHDSNCQTRC